MSLSKITHKNLRQSKNKQPQVQYPRKISIFSLNSHLQQITNNLNNSQCANSKAIVSKRLERNEKQAIKHFYKNQLPQCFDILESCLGILKTQHLSDHQIYIYYLYVEFLVKLQEYDNASKYYSKSQSIINKLNNQQTKTMAEYIVSLDALNISIQLSKGNYQKILNLISHLRVKHSSIKWTQKVHRLVANAQIEALMVFQLLQKHFKRYEDALQAIDNTLNKIETESETIKFVLKKIQCLMKTQYKSLNQVIVLIQSTLQYLKPQSITNNQSNLPIINHLYHQLISILQSPIKIIYHCQKWIQLITDNDEQVKIYKYLFESYYQLSDYESAYQSFKYINQKITSKEYHFYQKYAQIQILFGNYTCAYQCLQKALKLTDNDIAYCQIAIKILQHHNFDEDELKQFLKKIEKKISLIQQKNSNLQQNNKIALIRQRYVNFLKNKGFSEKVRKIEKLSNTLVQPITFGSSKYQSMKDYVSPLVKISDVF